MKVEKDKSAYRLMAGLLVSVLAHLLFFAGLYLFSIPGPASTEGPASTGGRQAPGSRSTSGDNPASHAIPVTLLAGPTTTDGISYREEPDGLSKINTDARPRGGSGSFIEEPGAGYASSVGESLSSSPMARSAREAFIARLAANKTYPFLARQRKIEGMVELYISLDQEGRLVGIEIVRTSGSRLLDSAAVSLVERSLPFAHGLARLFFIDVTIAYKFKD